MDKLKDKRRGRGKFIECESWGEMKKRRRKGKGGESEWVKDREKEEEEDQEKQKSLRARISGKGLWRQRWGRGRRLKM